MKLSGGKFRIDLKPRLEGKTLVVETTGDVDAVRAVDRALAGAWEKDWFAREMVLHMKRVLKRLDLSARSIFALVDDRDRMYFGREGEGRDTVGYIDANTRAIFGRSYAAEPGELVRACRAIALCADETRVEPGEAADSR